MLRLNKICSRANKPLDIFSSGKAACFSSKGEIEQHKSKDGETGFSEKEKSSNMLEVFATKRSPIIDLFRLNPMTVTVKRIRDWSARKEREAEIFNQRFLKERHDALGCDLATAHFITFRNGKVRFKDSNKWIEKPPDEDIIPGLPRKFVRNLFLEAIDASNTTIRHEGLKNFIRLAQLKWLSFDSCKFVDDWFVDRLSGEFSKTLEYLDLSNCHSLTVNCLSCFYRFEKLKTLVLRNVVNDKEFEYSCLLLEDAFPNLMINY